jgi:hypothetical protein
MNRFNRAECRHRKFAMVGRLAAGVALMTIGMTGGYAVDVIGGFFIAIHAIYLCLDPEELMEIPEEFFPQSAANDSEIIVRPSAIDATAKRPTAMPRRLNSNSGVWDRELDGVP